jgi:phosphoribosylaminoimidazolecarboxamide formyltransferase/IMP cyclohydrolase
LQRALAAKAFAHVSAYDAIVAEYLRAESPHFPDELTIAGRLVTELRYGENPAQSAAAYRRITSARHVSGVLEASQLHGKELSYNNLLDADAAWQALSRFSQPAVSIIKHTIPCGLAVHDTLAIAFERAFAGDEVSAYGGIVALNRTVDAPTAEQIAARFFEVVIAPGFAPEALYQLRRKKHLRLLSMPPKVSASAGLEVRSITGGMLVQDADAGIDDPAAWKIVSRREPTPSEQRDLVFAWEGVRHVKSNAIVLAREQALVGVGSGQPNRVESVSIAVRKAGDRSRGSVLASDAFFPFADGIEVAAGAGITAIVQPGGSVRDDEVVLAANEAGMAMLFTGVRHFRH